MNIGAVSGYGAISSLQNNYKINSIYGNPKSLQAVGKIGEERYSGNPFAVVTKNDEEALKIKDQQKKPFDLEGAVKRAEQGLASTPQQSIDFDYNAAMTRLMQGTRFSADTIPVADLTAAQNNVAENMFATN